MQLQIGNLPNSTCSKVKLDKPHINCYNYFQLATGDGWHEVFAVISDTTSCMETGRRALVGIHHGVDDTAAVGDDDVEKN